MAKVTLLVLSGSHETKVDGERVSIQKGETFVGDDSLLKAFGDKLRVVDAPAKAGAKKAAAPASTQTQAKAPAKAGAEPGAEDSKES